MITPAEIKLKAERHYLPFLHAARPFSQSPVLRL